MTEPFIDTNIFLRHLLNDDPVASPACFELIRRIEQGTLAAWTSDLVIAELVWVLSSKRLYNFSREDIREVLLPIINLPGLELPRKRLYERIFELYVTLPLDYIDAYHAALAQQRGASEIYSYDADFDRVDGLTRREP